MYNYLIVLAGASYHAGQTDTWAQAAAAVVKAADHSLARERMTERSPVFIAKGDDTPQEYTIGELRREVAR